MDYLRISDNFSTICSYSKQAGNGISVEHQQLHHVPCGRLGGDNAGAGPCAACKFLRRKCLPGCVAPYFPPEEPQKFANVHKVFGASNVTKLLNELLPHQREDAVSSLAYEAEARVKDPVYGCVGAISVLQRQVHRLQKELDAAHAELLRYACGEVGIPTALPVTAAPRLAAAMPPPAQLAVVSSGMYGGRRLGVVDGIAAPSPSLRVLLHSQ
ncbi:hypothetical protein GUJ93_ZPchr0001g30959 [Zizania palustris]|uniref:LOB domain-containing protein n=1 Tax=Zizania palustris TaxID=103762 RepID=A0A8J5RXJ9_ZIZPA|nr:hypothetical protein GUJ93_ZPchr0001g30959 [Zizania palustris]